MEFNPYLNFTEFRRLGLKFKAKRAPVITKNMMRPILYKDMVRKSFNDVRSEVDRQKPTFALDEADTGGIFNLDFSPDS